MSTPETTLVPLSDVAAPTPNSFVDGPFGSEMKSDEYTEEGVRLIQLQNIGDGIWIDENKKFISEEKFTTLKRHGAVPGDIAIAKMADPVARSCLLPSVAKQFIVVADCIKLTPDRSKYDAGFVSRAINSQNTRREAEVKSSGLPGSESICPRSRPFTSGHRFCATKPESLRYWTRWTRRSRTRRQ